MNYQQMLDKKIDDIIKTGIRPKLLLHSCCAPCSSYVLEYLSEYFEITLFYYNPNIAPEAEYRCRVEEVQRLLADMPSAKDVHFIEGIYDPESFKKLANGLKNEDEGGTRCFKCYRLRLKKTAEYASEHNFDYFTTTLSISPYKNAEKLNSIGSELGDIYSVKYLFSDFKKKNGYKRSIELSKDYDLYRQDYCGCIYSKKAAERKKNNGMS